ncbi:MAG: YlmC/YmxH family sporulation protein [Bacillota bacterium]|nr:YlmC/YmxH family sporulation protein [Bacillota bacterium]
MRLSEFAEKRIINVFDGELMGAIGDSDLLLDEESGRIQEILVPPSRRGLNRHPCSIPWPAVKKVGAEIVVVDVESSDVYYR